MARRFRISYFTNEEQSCLRLGVCDSNMYADEQKEYAEARRVVSILQPGYLPYPGFFELIARCDVFVIYDDVQYDKNSWRNRNRIRGPEGPIWLSVPVFVKGYMGQKIHEVRVNNQHNWCRKHRGSLLQYYGKAKYFQEYIPFFYDVYNRSWELLIDLNMAIINFFVRLFGLKTELVRSSALLAQGHKTERIIAICKELGADAYISTNGAKLYLDEAKFTREKIALAYQDYMPPEYDQGYPDFISNLSTIDLLFHCGPRALEIILMTSRCPFNAKNGFRGFVSQ